jgi:uncharacterized YigZ family protein
MKVQKILYEGGQGELVEKKSRFIATTCPVESEEQAIAFIAEMKKKYWDATHNCSAFVIGDQHQVQRCSDDGEPQGTAGSPMLDVLLGEDIHNIAVVVTRYFGGTLLGTGGLVRAYSKSVQEGIANSKILEKKTGILLKMNTDYNGIGKIQYILGKRGIPIITSEYGAEVELEALLPEDLSETIKEEITEATNGRTIYREETSVLYAFLDGEPMIF